MPKRRQPRLAVIAETGVLPLREGHYQPAPMPVLRHMSDPGAALSSAFVVRRRSSGAPCRTPRRCQPDASQRALRAAPTGRCQRPGDTEDLARAHREVHLPQLLDTERVVQRQPAHFERHRARISRALFDPQQHAARPSAPPIPAGWFGGGQRPDHLPRRITLTSSVTAMISRNLWVISRIVLPSDFRCSRIWNR